MSRADYFWEKNGKVCFSHWRIVWLTDAVFFDRVSNKRVPNCQSYGWQLATDRTVSRVLAVFPALFKHSFYKIDGFLIKSLNFRNKINDNALFFLSINLDPSHRRNQPVLGRNWPTSRCGVGDEAYSRCLCQTAHGVLFRPIQQDGMLSPVGRSLRTQFVPNPIYVR